MKYEESIVDSVVEGFVFYNVEESQSHESKNWILAFDGLENKCNYSWADKPFIWETNVEGQKLIWS